MKNRLMTPGPVPVSEDALLAMARPVIHHRTEEFRQVMAEVKDGLKYVFQTVNDVLILMASSTGAMESAVVNLLSPGDEVLVIKGGKFGERWGEICEAYNVKVHPVDLEWGHAVDVEVVKEKLDEKPNIKCVYSTLCETSTGIHHNIKELGEVVNKRDNTLLVVDAVSALGAVELQTDNWHVDVVVSGSQKGLMTPPGLGFISLSDAAWKFTEKSQLPGYYFDLSKTRECMKKNE
ncbi:aminotransferase class V-fold PLP-dependent enzyme, partial [Candidatus Poribacteria bacterium]|nr:aminotransferase class V-fold PLP-dependent enzyme [Candidatus Poribacteria bacterium]